DLFFLQAEDGIRDRNVTGVQTCALPIWISPYLPYGCYVVTETGTPDGYRSVEPFEVMVDAQGKIYKYILENSVYETDVKIVKKRSEERRVGKEGRARR